MSAGDRPPGTSDPGAPTFRVLSERQRQRIHDAALAVLEDPGVRITTPAAREVAVLTGVPYAPEAVDVAQALLPGGLKLAVPPSCSGSYGPISDCTTKCGHW